MKRVYEKYTVEEVKNFVEIFKPYYTLFIDVKGKGPKVPRGSDHLYDNMCEFLDGLDKIGYEIKKKQ